MPNLAHLYADQVRDLIKLHGFKKFIDDSNYVSAVRDGMLETLFTQYFKSHDLAPEQGKRRRQEILQRLELYLGVAINNEEDYATFDTKKENVINLRQLYEKLTADPCVDQLQYVTDTTLSFNYKKTDGRTQRLTLQEDPIGFHVKSRCLSGPIDTLNTSFIGPKNLRNLLTFVSENQHRFAIGLETTNSSWFINLGRYVFAPVHNADRVLLAISWVASISDYIESEFSGKDRH